MRLTEQQKIILKRLTAEIFGADARLILFGSRVNDNAKGGDIDLYIETPNQQLSFDNKIKLLTALNRALGEQKIDIVVNDFSQEKDIYTIAKQTGIEL